MDWIDLAQDRATFNAVIHYGFCNMREICLDEAVTFSRRTLFHGVSYLVIGRTE